jgi:hypothetical protein
MFSKVTLTRPSKELYLCVRRHEKTPNVDYLRGHVVKAEARYDDSVYVGLSTLPKQSRYAATYASLIIKIALYSKCDGKIRRTRKISVCG